MCEDCERKKRQEEMEEMKELNTLALLPTLPQELQSRIFEYCDVADLSTLCRLNKDWNERIVPFMWRNLDLVGVWEDEALVETTRQFFVVCDTLMDENPERWAYLAQLVRNLDLGRLHGINIVRDKEFDGHDFMFFDDWAVGKRNVFDVIAQFVNMEALSLYLKNWWGYTGLEASGEALAERLTNLKSLKIGGQVSSSILDGLLSKPETIEYISLFNLHCSPGQDNGPDGFSCFYNIHDRFTNLKTLHLCKLADLDGKLSDGDSDVEDVEGEDEEPIEYASGMRWRFPRESEVNVLKDWADLLRGCSNILQELTLENRYLCSFAHEDLGGKINPGVTHPAEYGAFSIRESQKFLFPVFDQEWPKLKKLVLIGMGEVGDVTQAICHLEPRVQVKQGLATLVWMGGDATPEQIATPLEFQDQDTRDREDQDREDSDKQDSDGDD